MSDRVSEWVDGVQSGDKNVALVVCHGGYMAN